MAGTVYLRTNRFEVKLEGITFKARDFETLCKADFLFPEGKIWIHRPVVGLDVMRHPRDPSIMLVLLCFGVGCIIMRFRSGESLPQPILNFLTDERICFVGFGIPEKRDLFPFEEMGLRKDKVDIGFLAAKTLKDTAYKRCELAVLARKVLGIKRMVGLTEASSFERHEQIKCAICQLFISSVIAMTLLGHKKKNLSDSPKKSSFLKTLNSLPLLNEGWFKLPKGNKDENMLSKFVETVNNFRIQLRNKEGKLGDAFVQSGLEGDSSDDSFNIKSYEGGLNSRYLQGKGYKEGGLNGDFVHVQVYEGVGLSGNHLHAKSYREGGLSVDLVNPKVYSDDGFYCDSPLGKGHEKAGFNGYDGHAKGHGEGGHIGDSLQLTGFEDYGGSNGDYFDSKGSKESGSGDDSGKDGSNKKPLKGILKCSSSGLEGNSISPKQGSPLSMSKEQRGGANLKRANSKGYNVSFSFK